MTAARTIPAATAACCACLIYGGVLGQESSRGEAVQQTRTAVDEEVIVRGRSRAALRLQFRLAEEAVYERFNEINSDDEFDIFCRRETLTGSRIPRRICQPNFWREAQARAGEETVRGLQGGSSISPQQFQGEALSKHQLFAEELRRLAAEDGQLLAALTRLANIQQAMTEDGWPRGMSTASSTREAAAGDEALPYDAVLVTDVRIGREDWSHALTRPTFTIAHVYGEVRGVELECAERTERLRYEAGVEWTLPDGWEACTMLVDAAPGTTFALYEFD